MFNSNLENSGKNGLFHGGGHSQIASCESQPGSADRLSSPSSTCRANRVA
jgi:hypothetical protein